MSTYAYSYLKSEMKGFSASYLSARSFKIKFDDEVVSDNLRDNIIISFDDLLKLHLFEINKKDESDKYIDFGGVVDVFSKLIEQDGIADFYSGYKEDIFKIDDKDRKKYLKICAKRILICLLQ